MFDYDDDEYRIGTSNCHISFGMTYPYDKDDHHVMIQSSIKCHQKALEMVLVSEVVSVPRCLDEAKRQVEMAWKCLDDNKIVLSKKERKESIDSAENFIHTLGSVTLFSQFLCVMIWRIGHV